MSGARSGPEEIFDDPDDRADVDLDALDDGDVVSWRSAWERDSDPVLGVVLDRDRLLVDAPDRPEPSAIRSGEVLEVLDRAADLLGIDDSGAYHIHSVEDHRILVRGADPDDGVDHIETGIFRPDVPEWVRFVRDRRGWERLASDLADPPEAGP